MQESRVSSKMRKREYRGGGARGKRMEKVGELEDKEVQVDMRVIMGGLEQKTC